MGAAHLLFAGARDPSSRPRRAERAAAAAEPTRQVAERGGRTTAARGRDGGGRARGLRAAGAAGPGAGPAAAAAAVPGAAPAAAAAAASRGRRGRQQQAREEPGTAHHQVRVATSGGQGRRPGSQSGECGRRGGGGLPSPRSREKTTPLSRGLGGAAWTRLPGTGKPASRGHVAGAQALDAGMGEGRGTRMARTDRVNQWGPALCRALDKEPRSSGAPAWLQALGVGTRGRPSVLVAPRPPVAEAQGVPGRFAPRHPWD